MDKCSIGLLNLTECHKTTYLSKRGLCNVSDLTEEELKLIKIRSELDAKEMVNICFHHKSLFLTKYEFLQKVCCDPYEKHKKPIKNGLRVVNFQQSEICVTKGLKVKPGEKLCINCNKTIFSTPINCEEDIHDKEFTMYTETETQLQKEDAIDSLNSSLSDVGCSPIKLHALNKNSKIGYAQSKLEQLQYNIRMKIETVLDVEVPSKVPKIQTETEKKAEEMDLLVENIKSEMTKLSSKKKVQLLTIPASLNWSRKKSKILFKYQIILQDSHKNCIKKRGFLPNLNRGKERN